MKKNLKHPIVVLALLALACSITPALGRGADWPGSTLTSAEDLGFLAVSASFEDQKRDVRGPQTHSAILRSRQFFGELSCDVISFLTLTAGAGSTEVKPQKYFDHGDAGLLWTAGAKLSLWEHLIEDPIFLANRLRLDTAVSYWDYESDYLGFDMDWNEIRASITFSTEFFVEDWGHNRAIYPYSIVFVAGAVFSQIDGDADTPLSEFNGVPGTPTSFEESDAWGALMAIDLYLSHNFSLSGEVRLFANATATFSAAFHF